MLWQIHTPRLLVRALHYDDAPHIQSLIGDFKVARMLAQVPYPYPENGAREFIAKTLAHPSGEGMPHILSICLKEGGLIGGFSARPQGKDELVIGYWLGRAFWGKGYMSEAAAAILKSLFADGTLIKVTAGVFADNPASQRLQEKLGFRKVSDTMRFSAARGHEAPLWETELTREDFLKAQP